VEDEESKAHIKAILGGLGIAIGCTFAGQAILRALIRFGNINTRQPASWVLHSYPRVKGVVSVLRAFARMLGGGSGGGWMGKMNRHIGVWGVLGVTGWVFVKWHGLFVDGWCSSHSLSLSF
jgi:hypothetical protein